MAVVPLATALKAKNKRLPKIVIAQPSKPLLILVLHTTGADLQILLGSALGYRCGTWQLGRELGKYLHSHLSAMMTATPWETLDAIAVHTGTGSQTGMRIGLTVAITLAQQLAIPLYAIATAASAHELLAIAEAQYNQGVRPAWQSAVASLSPAPLSL